jgi:thiol-disulfide isomerase/thioredoxin
MNPLMSDRRIVFIRLWFIGCVLTFLASTPLYGANPPTALAIQASAPDFALPGVDGKVHKLNDFRSSKVLVVVFLCNHCTTSQLYESRVEKIADDYRGKGVALIAMQSSNPESLPVEELAYTDVGDSLADMKIRAAYRHFSFPYLYDGDTQTVARSYGATVAPQVFVFDEKRKLRYEGSVDDNVNESLSKRAYTRDAIDALLAGKDVAEANTAASGCETQWMAKPAEIQAARAKMEAEPVKVSLVSADELTKLRTNPTGKLLLVNFYATWCGPCVSEFPDLMATNRMFRGRNFALTTVSSNEPEEQEDVLKFLRKMHGSTTNLLFATTDTYAMQAAFDPAMGPAVPFTVLIAPNGDILFQQQGDLDMMEVRRAILANLPDDSSHEGAQRYWATK